MTEVERMLPLHEGKMGHQYDYRAASFYGAGDTDFGPNIDHSPDAIVLPRFWVRESVVVDRVARRGWGTETALLGYRRVARNTDERTAIAAVLPFGPASYGWIISAGPDASHLALLAAVYNSFVFDYLLRQFLSQPSIPQGTFEQVPVPTVASIATQAIWLGDAARWFVERSAALVATGTELAAFAAEAAVPIANWDDQQRAELRSEIDAAMFHLYGIGRNDVDYIMETFPIVKRKDEQAHGEYRTKRLILENYDAMAEAIASGLPFVSGLDIGGANVGGEEAP